MIGKTHWAIADGYIPGQSVGPAPQMTSHEAVCILNCGESNAEVELMIYFSDRQPAGPYKFTVGGQRTKHIRFNNLTDPEPIPKDTDYACVISSSVPVIVQHTRLDSRQAENAIFSTIAYSE